MTSRSEMLENYTKSQAILRKLEAFSDIKLDEKLLEILDCKANPDCRCPCCAASLASDAINHVRSRPCAEIDGELARPVFDWELEHIKDGITKISLARSLVMLRSNSVDPAENGFSEAMMEEAHRFIMMMLAGFDQDIANNMFVLGEGFRSMIHIVAEILNESIKEVEMSDEIVDELLSEGGEDEDDEAPDRQEMVNHSMNMYTAIAALPKLYAASVFWMVRHASLGFSEVESGAVKRAVTVCERMSKELHEKLVEYEIPNRALVLLLKKGEA